MFPHSISHSNNGEWLISIEFLPFLFNRFAVLSELSKRFFKSNFVFFFFLSPLKISSPSSPPPPLPPPLVPRFDCDPSSLDDTGSFGIENTDIVRRRLVFFFFFSPAIHFNIKASLQKEKEKKKARKIHPTADSTCRSRCDNTVPGSECHFRAPPPPASHPH